MAYSFWQQPPRMSIRERIVSLCALVLVLAAFAGALAILNHAGDSPVSRMTNLYDCRCVEAR